MSHYYYYPCLTTPDEILEKYSQESIFTIVFGQDFKIEEKICSPFRKDSSPGCWIEYYNEKLWFVDFGDIKRTRDCFEIIKDKFNLNLQQACNYIVSYFLKSPQNLQPALKSQLSIGKTSKKKEFLIVPTYKNFNSLDRDFWSSYYITSKQLKEDKVFSVLFFKTLGFKNKDFAIRPSGICYAYTNFKSQHIKIYQPNAYLKKYKWFTNCTQDDVGNIHNIPIVDKTLIITKSYKDCRILINLGYNCIWFQNEGIFPSRKILYDLNLRFSEIYIFFDNDETGIRTANKLQQIFTEEFQHKKTTTICTPDQRYKDSGEFIKRFGQKELKIFLNTKIN